MGRWQSCKITAGCRCHAQRGCLCAIHGAFKCPRELPPEPAWGGMCLYISFSSAPKYCQWKVDGAVIIANHLLFKRYLFGIFYLLEENEGRRQPGQICASGRWSWKLCEKHLKCAQPQAIRGCELGDTVWLIVIVMTSNKPCLPVFTAFCDMTPPLLRSRG